MGGRIAAGVTNGWRDVGYPVVYCSADPATAILEVAVHKGLAVLDAVPHAWTRARIAEAADVHMVLSQLTPVRPIPWRTGPTRTLGRQSHHRSVRRLIAEQRLEFLHEQR